MVDELQRLAEAGALPLGQRDLVARPVVLDALAAPHLAADVDDLAGAAERLVVGDAVEALDHLRARRAEAEDAAAVGQGVDAGGGHGDQRRRAGVDRQDARRDLDVLGAGREVAHDADGVEAVGLGDPDHVEAGLLELDDLVDAAA